MVSNDAAFHKRTFFSLIELMLVASVILILGTLSVSSVVNSRRQARQAYCSNNLRQLALAFQMYQQDYKSYPVQERFLDDFRPVYTYLKSLSAFTCPGNPNTVSKVSTESSLVGGTDYVFWTGQLAAELPAAPSSTTDSGSNSSSGDSGGCNCNSNVCTCGRGNGNGNNGGNGNGNQNQHQNGNGHGNGNGNNGGNGNGNGNNGSSNSGSSTTSSTFFAYGADISDSKFQRTLADKLTRPVIYDKCGPAHGNYINLCDLRDASVSSRRDMCDLWVLNTSKELIVDSTDPFPK